MMRQIASFRIEGSELVAQIEAGTTFRVATGPVTAQHLQTVAMPHLGSEAQEFVQAVNRAGLGPVRGIVVREKMLSLQEEKTSR